MQSLNITLLQTDIEWENIESNLEHLSRQLRQCQSTDFVLLPEMFATGFTMCPERVAQTANGTIAEWLNTEAHKHTCAIGGSVAMAEGHHYYNRFVCALPTGQQHHYNKRYLFSPANEHLHYTAGYEKVTFDYHGWRIKPLICYDLRFPEWSRNTVNGYDLLLYVANWPAARNSQWLTLLQARAIENQCYVAATNRTGTDGNGLAYAGSSCIISPRGEIMAGNIENEPSTVTATLSYTDLVQYRSQFPVLADA